MMEAGKRTINDIFNRNRILEVPFFQRAYVWEEPQWERFLNDMIDVSNKNKPYFLGSIIMKQQLTEGNISIGDKRTIIDGQQRLTTLNIFFKVLSLHLDNTYFCDIFRLPMQNNEIAILHNHNDIFAFNRIMNLKKDDTIPEEILNEEELKQKDHISQAYIYFKKNVNASTLNFQSIQNILTNIMFVGIDLGSEEDEQQIFDTINSLGVSLSTADHLKNYFFGRNEITLYENHWLAKFEKDEEKKKYWDAEITAGRFKRSFIDLFFYSFLQIKIQDSKLKVKTDNKIEFTKVEGLFNSYKKFIKDYKIDKISLLEEISEYADVFYDNFKIEILNRELPGSNGIERINAIIFGLENTTLIPYVLFVQKNVTDNEEKNNIFRYLETYIMRRMVCHTTNKNYNQLFSERLITNNILTKDDLKNFIEQKTDSVNYMPSDEELKKGFFESKLINKQSTGILYLIETKIRNRISQSTAPLGMKHYSLEHMMPKKWENNWGKLSNYDDINKRNRVLLTLGNLTIITASLNSTISDANWRTKIKGRGDKYGLKYYSAGLETISNFLEYPEWNEQTIEERALFLYNKAVAIWKD